MPLEVEAFTHLHLDLLEFDAEAAQGDEHSFVCYADEPVYENGWTERKFRYVVHVQLEKYPADEWAGADLDDVLPEYRGNRV